MKRRLLNLLTALSLVLCAGTAMMWARSYHHGDQLSNRRSDLRPDGAVVVRSTALSAMRGGIGVSTSRDVYPSGYFERQGGNSSGALRRHALRWETWGSRPQNYLQWAGPGGGHSANQWRRGGFQALRVSTPVPTPDALAAWDPYGGTPGHGVSQYAVVAPCWFVVLVTAALPVIRLARRRTRLRRRRAASGLCTECGYDLKGNVSGTCPECGATAPTQAAQ